MNALWNDLQQKNEKRVDRKNRRCDHCGQSYDPTGNTRIWALVFCSEICFRQGDTKNCRDVLYSS